MSLFSKAAPWVTGITAVAALVAIVWSYLQDSVDLPTHTQKRFVGLVVLAAIAVIIATWTAASRNQLAWSGVAISGFVAIGLWLNSEFGGLAGVTWAVASTAVVSFVTLLSAGRERKLITKNTMRNAIAGSFVLTYLIAVALVLFLHDKRRDLPAITSSLVNNFTTLMEFVMAFYFGGATVEKVTELRARVKEGANQEAISEAAEH